MMAEVSNDRSQHGMWSSRMLFVLAAVGSAVGLGNIWKFPYMAGDHGGAAFFFVYLICICLIGFPVMLAEIMIGREGRMSPINSLRQLARRNNLSQGWGLIGWFGVFTGFLILSFYAVVAGWILFYVFRMFSGEFNGVDIETAGGMFGDFIGDWKQVALWFTIFMVITGVVVAKGVNKGLEVVVRYGMPVLFLLLLVMLIYGITQGGFGDAFSFMFILDFNNLGLSWDSLVRAMGHAFFTLSIGMGAIMAYGAYMPREGSIKSAVWVIVVVDTLVAIVAGLAIFSIAYAHGSEPHGGPALLFITSASAFGNLPLGAIFGGLLFVLVSIAALTSAISILEPATAYLVERFKLSRWIVVTVCCLIAWIIGWGTVLSFNAWQNLIIIPGFGDGTFFAVLEFLVDSFLLPIGGLLIAIFVGFILPRSKVKTAIEISTEWGMKIWLALIRVIAPLSILVIFAITLLRLFGLTELGA